MTEWNIVAVGILALLFVIDIAVRIHHYRKNNPNIKFDIDTFINLYEDKITEAINNIREMLSINRDDFATESDYEREIIRLTVEALKENAEDLGVNSYIVNMFDTMELTEVVYRIINKITLKNQALPKEEQENP